MNKYLKFLLFLALIVSLVFSGTYFFKEKLQKSTQKEIDNLKNYELPNISIENNTKDLPIYKDFDPTTSTVMFKILDINVNGSIKVIPVFPETYQTNKILDINVNCKDDTYFVNTFNQSKEIFDIQNLKNVENIDKLNMMLGGKCSDSSCTQLIRECVVYENSN